MPIQLPIYADDDLSASTVVNSSSSHYNPFIEIESGSASTGNRKNISTMFRQKAKNRILFYLSRQIFGIPILNWLIITSLSMALIKLTFHYHKLYTKSSIIATCLTNVVLFSISDTLAQSIAFYQNKTPVLGSYSEDGKHNSQSDIEAQTAGLDYNDNVPLPQRPRARTNSSSSIFVDYGIDRDNGIKMGNYNDHTGGNDGPIKFHSPSSHSTAIFDFRRFFGFVAWGFLMAFIQVAWYLFLNSMYQELPYLVTVCARVITDQLCFSPVSLYCFFVYSTLILESGTHDDLYVKIKKIYLSTLVANYAVWIPVQFMNFLIMPRNLQVPFSSSIGVIWNCFLSMKNAANAA